MNEAKITCPVCQRKYSVGDDGKFPLNCTCGYDFTVPPKARSKLPSLLWLLLAFVPAFFLIPLVQSKNPDPWVTGVSISATVVCCLLGSFGFLRAFLKHLGLRIVLGLVLALMFVVLHAVIAIFVGCSGMRF